VRHYNETLQRDITMRGENCPSIDVVGVLKVESSFAPKKESEKKNRLVLVYSSIHLFIERARNRQKVREREFQTDRAKERALTLWDLSRCSAHLPLRILTCIRSFWNLFPIGLYVCKVYIYTIKGRERERERKSKRECARERAREGERESIDAKRILETESLCAPAHFEMC